MPVSLGLFFALACLALTGCTRPNPAYCGGPGDCPDPARPVCDPVIHTCVGQVPLEEPDGGPEDGDGPDGATGDGHDAADEASDAQPQGTVWVADCGGTGTGTQQDPFCSLAAGVEAGMARGARVVVLPGTYTESLTLQRDVSIEGRPGAIIAGPTCPVLSILGGAEVRLSGLEFQGGSGLAGLVQVAGGARLVAGGLTLGPSECLGLRCFQASCELHGSRVWQNQAGGLDLNQAAFDVQSCVVAHNGGLGATAGARLTSPMAGSRLAFTTLADNRGQTGFSTGGVECVNPAELDSCILWDNEGDQASNLCILSHSNIDQAIGGNNQRQDPLFVAPGALDYRLRPGSPSIDSGNPNATAIPDDPDGTPRPQGARADQGGYEHP
jgi:hypothetical protein